MLERVAPDEHRRINLLNQAAQPAKRGRLAPPDQPAIRLDPDDQRVARMVVVGRRPCPARKRVMQGVGADAGDFHGSGRQLAIIYPQISPIPADLDTLRANTEKESAEIGEICG
jgi:hypothetical protein